MTLYGVALFLQALSLLTIFVDLVISRVAFLLTYIHMMVVATGIIVLASSL